MTATPRQEQLDAMQAHLAECDRIFEATRLADLAELPKLNVTPLDKARRRVVVVQSVATALLAKLAHLDTAPNCIDAALFEPHRAGLVAQIKQHRTYLANVQAELEALEKEARRGKDIARRNAVVGLRKVSAAIGAEVERHQRSMARATTDEAIEREEQRHETNAEDIAIKASACLAALLASA